MSDKPCQFCGNVHVNWWDECDESAAAMEKEMRQRQEDKRKAEEMRLESIRKNGTPVGYINEFALKGLLDNKGVLAKIPFDYRLSQEPNDSQTLPLYLAGPAAPRVETPTEAGWYWLYMDGLLTIEHVFTRPGHDYLAVQQPDIGLLGKRSFLAVAKIRGDWYGPIPKPEL